jgi:hypothetical protein
MAESQGEGWGRMKTANAKAGQRSSRQKDGRGPVTLKKTTTHEQQTGNED